MQSPKNFDELVTWATWRVVEGITKGEPLRSVMYSVLMGAMNIMSEWQKK